MQSNHITVPCMRQFFRKSSQCSSLFAIKLFLITFVLIWFIVSYSLPYSRLWISFKWYGISRIIIEKTLSLCSSLLKDDKDEQRSQTANGPLFGKNTGRVHILKRSRFILNGVHKLAWIVELLHIEGRYPSIFAHPLLRKLESRTWQNSHCEDEIQCTQKCIWSTFIHSCH